MHYILKLPGTIAQVVSYPTTCGPFRTVNEASQEVMRINLKGSYSGVIGSPLFPFPKEQKAA